MKKEPVEQMPHFPTNTDRWAKGFPALREESVIAFDPGETTGVCMVYRGRPFATASLSQEEILAWCADELDLTEDFPEFKPKAVIVEEWRLRPNTAKFMIGHIMIPTQMIGMLRLMTHKKHLPLRVQQASIKAYVTKEKLEFYEWDKVGRTEHERDAAKHALYYLTNHKDYPEYVHPPVPPTLNRLNYYRKHLVFDEGTRTWKLKI